MAGNVVGLEGVAWLSGDGWLVAGRGPAYGGPGRPGDHPVGDDEWDVDLREVGDSGSGLDLDGSGIRSRTWSLWSDSRN